MLLLWLPACLLLATAQAAAVQGRLSGVDLIRSDTRILLDSKTATWVRQDGSFEIPDVEEGRYVLVIDSKDYLFPSYSLSVLASGGVLVKSHEVHRIPAENAPLLPHPLSITPLSKAEYVEPIKPFNLQGLVLGNPLILLMVGGGLLMFLMPKLMSAMDPEALKEMQESQAQLHKSMQSGLSIGDSLSGILAGASTGSSTSVAKGNTQAKKRK